MSNSLSRQNLSASAVYEHYTDIEASIRLYFSSGAPDYGTRFFGYSVREIGEERAERSLELDLAYSMTLLASLEAAFQVDYLNRCEKKRRDALSRAFRQAKKAKKGKLSLEDDILRIWKDHFPSHKALIGEFVSALRYRHWLAHGRYWEPKLGRSRYDFFEVWTLASAVYADILLITA